MNIFTTGARSLTRTGQQLARVISNEKPIASLAKHHLSQTRTLTPITSLWHCHSFHTSSNCDAKHPKVPVPKEPIVWPQYNDIVYPPQKAGEPPRPAEITHYRSNIKYSGKKLWYIGLMIRGKSVDEAVKQLSFYKRKGAQIVQEILLEAQELAVKEHNVEFKSNLWVADAFHKHAMSIKAVRKGGRGRFGTIHYRYTHFFVRLREGSPPEHYYQPEPTGHEKLENYLQQLRARRIKADL